MYIKIPDNYFRSEVALLLKSFEIEENLPELWLKFVCLGAKHNGILSYGNEVPFDDKALATILGETEKTINNAIGVFSIIGLIDDCDYDDKGEGPIIINNIEKYLIDEKKEEQ